MTLESSVRVKLHVFRMLKCSPGKEAAAADTGSGTHPLTAQDLGTEVIF